VLARDVHPLFATRGVPGTRSKPGNGWCLSPRVQPVAVGDATGL